MFVHTEVKKKFINLLTNDVLCACVPGVGGVFQSVRKRRKADTETSSGNHIQR